MKTKFVSYLLRDKVHISFVFEVLIKFNDIWVILDTRQYS